MTTTDQRDFLDLLARYVASGDKVTLAYVVGGKTHKDGPMPAETALYAASTVHSLGGALTSVFRYEDDLSR